MAKKVKRVTAEVPNVICNNPGCKGGEDIEIVSIEVGTNPKLASSGLGFVKILSGCQSCRIGNSNFFPVPLSLLSKKSRLNVEGNPKKTLINLLSFMVEEIRDEDNSLQHRTKSSDDEGIDDGEIDHEKRALALLELAIADVKKGGKTTERKVGDANLLPSSLENMSCDDTIN
jgi:hypothetical protein